MEKPDRPGGQPVRLFKSDFLEFFTHVHPAAVLAVWIPVVVLFLFLAIKNLGPGRIGEIAPCILGGLFLWTLVEYGLHRFVFHHKPKTPYGERISFLFHGVHHAQPLVKTRLVMPPAVSVSLGTGLFALYALAGIGLWGSPGWTYAVFAGSVLGYLCYDMLHYSTHHFRLRSPILRYLRRYHMHHHVQTPNLRFGVTSPLWDAVFGTMPRGRETRTSK